MLLSMEVNRTNKSTPLVRMQVKSLQPGTGAAQTLFWTDAGVVFGSRVNESSTSDGNVPLTFSKLIGVRKILLSTPEVSPVISRLTCDPQANVSTEGSASSEPAGGGRERINPTDNTKYRKHTHS